MAPKSKKRGGAAEDDVFRMETEEHKEEQLNLGDSGALKRALDEAVIEAIADAGHEMDNTLTDLKIALGLGACALACVAQFYPKKYPDNFWVLLGCVAAYVVLSTAMTVVATVWEKDAVLFTRGLRQGGGPPALAVSTRLPRFQETFTLTITPRGARAASGAGASMSCSIGEYFHSDGYLAKDVVRADTQRLLAQLLEDKSK
ncbi:putative signal peptidase complex subunit 2 [Micractinium conductrix]|uniref:Signal peptidase complex subunit 2 n=1 Tax=Micractinium conductrix TaxID=554055 RepID=A0A2P6VSE7_9CHLO|nr:putative signal peptidase complex subunit 2 [Micractinium conductrix]|eukprot:PSC77014.1 putative signal peptidase complex subunit 2 [Micractinium conductrix]